MLKPQIFRFWLEFDSFTQLSRQKMDFSKSSRVSFINLGLNTLTQKIKKRKNGNNCIGSLLSEPGVQKSGWKKVIIMKTVNTNLNFLHLNF